jgi:hypothetical protein
MNLLVTLIAAAATTAVSPGQSVGIDGVQSLGDSRHHTFESQTLDKNLHIVVGLPADYDESGDTEYPTVYVLDGGVHYATLRGYHRYLRVGEEVPEIILVAISYGTDDWGNGNDRSEDYTAPTDEREFWGGAGDFQEFLGSELIPFIESSYRSKSDRRIIFGQSIAGQFVLYTAQTKPTLFWGHIASNPALHRNLPLFLQMHPATPADGVESARGDPPGTYAFFGAAGRISPGYGVAVLGERDLVAAVFLIQKRLDIFGRGFGRGITRIEYDFPFTVRLQSPDGTEGAPVLGLITVIVSCDHAIRTPCEGKRTVLEYLNELRPPFDCRTVIRQKNVPCFGDGGRPARDGIDDEPGIRINKRNKRFDIACFGGNAEPDLLATHLVSEVGKRCRAHEKN